MHAVAAALAFSRAHELYIIQHDTMCQKNSLRGLRTRFFFAKGGRRAAQNSLEKHDEKWVENLTPRAPAPGQNGPPDRAPAAARIARSRKAVCYRRSARVLKRKVTRPPPRPHRHTPLSVRCRHTRARAQGGTSSGQHGPYNTRVQSGRWHFQRTTQGGRLPDLPFFVLCFLLAHRR